MAKEVTWNDLREVSKDLAKLEYIFSSRSDSLDLYEEWDNDKIKANITSMDKLDARLTKLERQKKKRGR